MYCLCTHFPRNCSNMYICIIYCMYCLSVHTSVCHHSCYILELHIRFSASTLIFISVYCICRSTECISNGPEYRILIYLDHNISRTKRYLNHEVSRTWSHLNHEVSRTWCHLNHEVSRTWSHLNHEVSRTWCHLNHEVSRTWSHLNHEVSRTWCHLNYASRRTQT